MSHLKPGGVADRAVKHLQSLPPGTELSPGELGMAIDYDGKSLISFMGKAIADGLVIRRLTAARNSVYSLPGPTPRRVASVFELAAGSASDAPPPAEGRTPSQARRRAKRAGSVRPRDVGTRAAQKRPRTGC